MKNLLLAAITILLLISQGYCQNAQDLVGQATELYFGETTSVNNLIAGFSVSGLIGGILFGSIGFVAFMFGKKNSEFRPMIMGILLMGYPYFVRNTTALYAAGIILTVILFKWKE